MTTNCKIELIGSIDKAPKLISKKGLNFLVWSVATRDDYTDAASGRNKEKTLWHHIMAYDEAVIQSAKNLQKGEKVRVVGTLSYKPIEAIDGFKKPQASIVATMVETEV